MVLLERFQNGPALETCRLLLLSPCIGLNKDLAHGPEQGVRIRLTKQVQV
jgi:hypothetical protein